MSKRYPYQIVLTIIFLCVGLIQAPLLADSSKSISQDVLNEILENKEISHFSIEVSDSLYAVSVRGKVATDSQKQMIIDIAKKYAGSREIEDQITVTKDKFGSVDATDSEITNEIQLALRRENITGATFKVNQGVVAVGGDFKAFRDVDYLFSLIQTVPGVKTIDSRATVNSRPYMAEFTGRGKDFNERK